MSEQEKLQSPNGREIPAGEALPSLPIAPIPVHFNVGVADMGTDRAVVLHGTTPLGSAYYFIDADFAEALAKQLEHFARQARTGIVVAPGGLIAP